MLLAHYVGVQFLRWGCDAVQRRVKHFLMDEVPLQSLVTLMEREIGVGVERPASLPTQSSLALRVHRVLEYTNLHPARIRRKAYTKDPAMVLRGGGRTQPRPLDMLGRAYT